MSTYQSTVVDEAKLQAFMGKMVGDMGSAMSGALVLIGDRLGLYKALAEGGPADSDELARRTGTTEWYVREWLAAQAASGYVEYDPASRRFSMTAEQAMALATEASPVYVAGAFDVIASAYLDEPKITAAFRTGNGVGAAAHIRQALKPDGTFMLVEPFAGDDLKDNLNPVGRLYYAASTMVCTPSSLSQEVGLGLGAQAGEARLREVVTAGGFTRFRRAAETPFNLILEARP
jgi:hypothetical protein